MTQAYPLGVAPVEIDGHQIIANTLEAEALKSNIVTVENLAELFAVVNTVRSTNYAPGSAGNSPVGYKLAGTPFASILKDGSTLDACQFDLGGSANLGGIKTSSIVGKVASHVNIYGFVGTGVYQNFTVPVGITSVELIACGGGAGGHAGTYYNGGGAGGAGGGFRIRLAVSPGTTVSFVVGKRGLGNQGGAAAQMGGDTTVSYGSLVFTAKGGRCHPSSVTGASEGGGVDVLIDPNRGGVHVASGGAASPYETDQRGKWASPGFYEMFAVGGGGGGAYTTGGGFAGDKAFLPGLKGTGSGVGGGGGASLCGRGGQPPTPSILPGPGGGGGGGYERSGLGQDGGDGLVIVKW